ncbi:MAG: excinuclease ABC subunit UvrB [Phycisphaerales bacterium]
MNEHRALEVVAPFEPTGDQPSAIEALVRRLSTGGEAGRGARSACLLGATGTGKTFTMAHTIARLGKPTLILSHNKTLAAQLYEEMKELFPKNAVSYFVSYYDYYQPEAYIPARDIYIEKDSSRNDDLDKLRLAATSNILSRRDTIVVASVSCIFGLGSPLAYGSKVLTLERGREVDRRAMLLQLNGMQYARTDIEFARGNYRVRGDVIDIWPAYEAFAVRVELGGASGSAMEAVRLINPTSGEEIAEESRFFLFPARHYVTDETRMQEVLAGIRAELTERVERLRGEGKLLEAQRLLARTKYDLEMLEETGICNGVENYSRHLDGRAAGERPWTLLDYFDFAPAAGDTGPWPRAETLAPASLGSVTHPASTLGYGGPVDAARGESVSGTGKGGSRPPNLGDWLLIIDESHVTIPQVHAMFNGDQARKKVLVEHGFRLPSAMDNRPLRFEEFERIVPRMLFVSATPGPWELEQVGGEVAEQVIRPTGLLDPTIEIKPARGQVPDLIERCVERAKADPPERVIVTALTKRLCEDLTLFLHQKGLRVRYLHSEIDTLERIEILTDLRRGEFDVLVGVNLLREGLDLPEVSLVAILDADKEGFLRSTTSLIQQIGRAARNVNAHVVMYADSVTPSMQAAIDETERRRSKQEAYNAEHGITPQTIRKAIRRGMESELRAQRTAREAVRSKEPEFEVVEMIRMLEDEMLGAAAELEFEKAAKLRDQVQLLKSGKHPANARAEQSGGKMRRSDLERNGTASSVERAGMPGARAKPRGRGRGKR